MFWSQEALYTSANHKFESLFCAAELFANVIIDVVTRCLLTTISTHNVEVVAASDSCCYCCLDYVVGIVLNGSVVLLHIIPGTGNPFVDGTRSESTCFI